MRTIVKYGKSHSVIWQPPNPTLFSCPIECWIKVVSLYVYRVPTYVHAYVPYIHTYVRMYVRTYIHTYVCTYVRAYVWIKIRRTLIQRSPRDVNTGV